MKKITFIISCLLLVTVSKAQITITNSDMPVAGDSVMLSITNTIGTIDETLTGPNYNWDYSTLTYNSQQEQKFDSPFTFPSIYALLFSVLNTSFGMENRNLTSLPIPGVTFSAAYDFYKESSSSLKQVGSGYTINGTPLPFLYTADDVRYTFPMNYGNTDSCDYKYGLPIPTIGYYGQTGHRVNVIDGWGTLITPLDTFQTLRVKSIITSSDTIYLSSLSFGSNVPQPKRVEYKWLAAGKQIPVLEIDGTINGTNITLTNVAYQDVYHSGAGVNELAENQLDFSLFPNPSSDNVALQFSLIAASSVKITIADVIGKTLASVEEGVQTAGTHLKVINTKDLNLSKGVYFIILQSGNDREVKKLVVQ